jgi:hypothetical protein
VNLYFRKVILENRKGGSKREKEPNLTATKTTLEGSRGHHKTPHRGEPQKAARWGQMAPPWCRPVPHSGPYLSASRSFLYRLLGLHPHRSSSRFDLRAHVLPLGLYNQALSPPRDIHICHKSRLDQKLGFPKIREREL